MYIILKHKTEIFKIIYLRENALATSSGFQTTFFFFFSSKSVWFSVKISKKAVRIRVSISFSVTVVISEIELLRQSREKFKFSIFLSFSLIIASNCLIFKFLLRTLKNKNKCCLVSGCWENKICYLPIVSYLLEFLLNFRLDFLFDDVDQCSHVAHLTHVHLMIGYFLWFW